MSLSPTHVFGTNPSFFFFSFHESAEDGQLLSVEQVCGHATWCYSLLGALRGALLHHIFGILSESRAIRLFCRHDAASRLKLCSCSAAENNPIGPSNDPIFLRLLIFHAKKEAVQPCTTCTGASLEPSQAHHHRTHSPHMGSTHSLCKDHLRSPTNTARPQTASRTPPTRFSQPHPPKKYSLEKNFSFPSAHLDFFL
jgi:hypothetical protein